jgi:putative ABC transport system permease protein
MEESSNFLQRIIMKDYLTFAVQSIMHRQLRSWLTIIGIVIGIAAIITLISVSQGLENAITYEFEKIGTNRIYVFPQTSAGILGAAQGAEGLTQDDVDFLDGFSEFEYISPYLMQRATIYFGEEEIYTGVIGIDEEDNDIRFPELGVSLESGRWLYDGEDDGLIIGWDVAHSLYKKDIYVNNKLEINGEKYPVVGILNRIGNEQDDSQTYIAMSEARIIHNEEDEVSFIELVVQEDLDVNEVAEKVIVKLERYRDADDFSVSTPEQLLAQFNSLLNIIQVVLAGIAAISLVVGGIGIMNSMYTNVLERKKEIGILKSIGAGPKDIQGIFIVEAGLIGLLGGVLGAAIGTLLAFGIEFAAQQAGFLYMRIQVEPFLVIFGILFAFVVGMLSGYLPARKASQLTPVEALRE